MLVFGVWNSLDNGKYMLLFLKSSRALFFFFFFFFGFHHDRRDLFSAWMTIQQKLGFEIKLIEYENYDKVIE